MYKGTPRDGTEGSGLDQKALVTYISSKLGKEPPELPDLLTLVGLNVGVMGAWGLQGGQISGHVWGRGPSSPHPSTLKVRVGWET